MHHKNKAPWLTIIVILGGMLVAWPVWAAVTKLSGTMPTDGDVSSYTVSATGNRVVFLADKITDEVFELYSTTIAGGPPVKLHTGHVSSYTVSPDGQRVVFTSGQHLYSTAIDGTTAPITISVNLDGAPSFYLSPDSKTVVYAGTLSVTTQPNPMEPPITTVYPKLYSVAITGTAASGVELSQEWGDGAVAVVGITPNSQTVVFAARSGSNTPIKLYSIPITGPNASAQPLATITANGGTGPTILAAGTRLTPDGASVILSLDKIVTPLPAPNYPELYRIAITGPENSEVRLDQQLTDNHYVSSYEISPDSSRVVYVINHYQLASSAEVYSVPTVGPASSAIKISPTFSAGSFIYSRNLAISPNSTHVAYWVDNAGSSHTGIHTVPITGPTTSDIRLSPHSSSLSIGFTSSSFSYSPTGQWLVFRNNSGVFSVPSLGGTENQLSNLPHGTFPYLFSGFHLSPDGQRIIYAGNTTTTTLEAYSVPIGGPAAAAVKLNGTLVSGGNVIPGLQFSADGARVMYVADQETDGQFELYASDAGYINYSQKLYLPLVRR
ncbi:MAG: PD40 domain-containing protein [Anaerolineales bacterium]|nr:PD40 domain-containing protein [Anaerolineales bacterium]